VTLVSIQGGRCTALGTYAVAKVMLESSLGSLNMPLGISWLGGIHVSTSGGCCIATHDGAFALSDEQRQNYHSGMLKLYSLQANHECGR
jgi:hypothetical protein